MGRCAVLLRLMTLDQELLVAALEEDDVVGFLDLSSFEGRLRFYFLH
jgi:hypothetical protein